MLSFKVPQRASRRTLVAAAATATVIIGSAVVVVAPSASAEVVACNGATKNWAALYPSVNDWDEGEGAIACIGYVSTNNLSDNFTAVFCAGNNQGYVTYYDFNTGTTATHTFWPDASYAVYDGTYVQDPGSASVDPIDVEKVQITGWSGSAGC